MSPGTCPLARLSTVVSKTSSLPSLASLLPSAYSAFGWVVVTEDAIFLAHTSTGCKTGWCRSRQAPSFARS